MSDPLISDSQFGALVALATGGGLAATVKWAVTRLVESIDKSTTAWINTGNQLTAMVTKLDEVHDWMQDHETPPVVEESPPRRRTSPKGVPIGDQSIHRARTRSDGDK